MPRFQRTFSLISCVLLLGFVLGAACGCGRSETSSQPIGSGDVPSGAEIGDGKKPLLEIELALNWYPEAEHGGYFAAQIHGDFAAEGLTVKITPGGKGVPVVANVATGRVPFAVANAEQVLTGRASEANVVAVFAPIQTSPRCIMVHRKSGIKTFADLKNMKLAVNPSPFEAVLRKNVALEGCLFVPYDGQVTTFLLNENLAQQGYVFSEPFVARQNGADPHVLMAPEIGFNPYTSVLIVSDETLREKPDLVRKVVAASRRGWIKYLSDPEQTNQLIHEKNPEMPLDVLTFGVTELKKLCYSETVTDANFGSMTVERWTDLQQQLEDCSVLEPMKVVITQAFSTQFDPPRK